jgi:hypothetical protein
MINVFDFFNGVGVFSSKASKGEEKIYSLPPEKIDSLIYKM